MAETVGSVTSQVARLVSVPGLFLLHRGRRETKNKRGSFGEPAGRAWWELAQIFKREGNFFKRRNRQQKNPTQIGLWQKDPIDVALYVCVKTCLSKQINIFIKLNLIFTSKARTNLHVSKQICNVLFNYSNGHVGIFWVIFHFSRESRYLWQILPSHCCQIIYRGLRLVSRVH